MVTLKPWNFFFAVFRALKAKLRGYEVFAVQSVVDARVSVCEQQKDCFDDSSRQCRECSCFVDAKAMFATEKCPQKKWKV